MHNSGIVESQYRATQKIKNCGNMKKIVNEEAETNNQTQLKTTGRNVEGERKMKTIKRKI